MKKINRVNEAAFNFFRNAPDSVSAKELREKLADLHPADIADLYEDLGDARRKKFLDAIPDMINAEVLLHLEDTCKSEVIKQLGTDHFRPSLDVLQSEEIIELIESLAPREQMYFMNIIRNTRRDALNLLTEYSEDAVGRSMSLSFLSVPYSWTVEEAIAYIKSRNVADDCSEIFIANDMQNPVGVIPISTLIAAGKEEILKDIASYDIITLNANLDQEKAYALFSKYRFLHIPVVEKSGKMVGVLRADDVLKIAEEEAKEDYLKLGGLSEGAIADPFWKACFTRLRWLSVSILNAIFSPLIIYLFRDSIQQTISLATLMPIVGSIGGNIGVQAVSVVIKAFSSERLREQKHLKIVLKEAGIGSINGLVIGTFFGISAGIWFGSAILGIVLAAAMFFCSVWAAFTGALLPVVFDRLGYDSALSSGPLVTAVTDISGFVIFLGLAALFVT
ncbi:MAG: magnesium transporter [Holosporaceae bacterium]|jgi:magnesium transporter|nr:magnesium transporter [Holosporaceae bacterium]